MRFLYIYGGSKDYKISINKRDFIYHINTGVLQTESDCLDDLRMIHDIALNIKVDYINYINSLNRSFIENELIYEKSISLFYFSDLFNKRSELFDTYISICHIIQIKNNIIKKYKIDCIKTIECSDSFNVALTSIINNFQIIIANEKKNKISLLQSQISQCKYFFESIIKLIILKFYFNDKNIEDINSLFLTRYPLHFNKEFLENKYGSLVKSNDFYLISMLTDGLHQNLKIGNIKDYTKILNKKNNVIFLDYHLKIIDFFYGFIKNVTLHIKSARLYNKQYFFKGINITKYIQKEIHQSFIRIPRLLSYGSAIKKVFSKYNIKQSIFYLHEYSYGRYYNYILAKYFPNVKRVGFQHGPAAKRKLLYYLGKNVVSNSFSEWLYKTPIPNTVLAEDELSKEVYDESGFNNVQIMEKIYRLEYLKKIKRDKIVKNIVLIVPGLHDGLLMLEKLCLIIQDNPEQQFILKPHPRSRHFALGIPEKYNFKNISLGNEHISKYLKRVSKVFVTYSSVGYEAYLLGIPVRVICLPNKINESPLLDIYEKEKPDLISIDWN